MDEGTPLYMADNKDKLAVAITTKWRYANTLALNP